MKTVMKKMLALVLALVLCVTLYAGTQILNVSAENAGNANAEVLGASIRFISNNTMVDGIRFAVGMKTTDFNALTDAQKANYHLLVMPTQLVDGDLEKGEAFEYGPDGAKKYARAQDIAINWDMASNETRDSVDYKVVRIYLNEINSAYYLTDVTARAYYEENSVVTYSAPIQRSYYNIADAALEDLEDSQKTGYNNSVGSKFSPYTAAQRDALLGVKYDKKAVWDYVDGNLVSYGSERTKDDTLIHGFAVDRVNKPNSSNYIINTSLYVGFKDEPSFATNEDALKGFMFGYNETDGSYYLLDFRYRDGVGDARFSAGWHAWIRHFNGTSWGTVAGQDNLKLSLNQGMNDFRISVNNTNSEITNVSVEAKAPSERIYKTYINTAANGGWTDGKPKLTGNKFGYCAQVENRTFEFDPDMAISNDAIETRGNSTVKSDAQLAADGTGTIKGSFIHDFRGHTEGVRREGIKFSGENGNGYTLLFRSGNVNAPCFYILLWKWNGSSFANPDMDPGCVYPSYAETGAAAALQENDEILVDYEVKIYIAGGYKRFDISYTLSCGDWSYSGVYKTYDKQWMSYIEGSDIYYLSEDNGNETNLNTSDRLSAGDGKTVYYSTTVLPNEQEDPIYQTSGGESVKLNKTLSADGTGTIAGQFITDYRTAGDNERKEGIKFSGENGDGYYFWVGAQPNVNNGRFYIGMWRNCGGQYIWNNGNMDSGASVPAYSLAADAGLTLQDNDEIIVDYEIKITINASNQKAFAIKYRLSHDGVNFYNGGWNLVDNRVNGYFRGGSVYLFSEDNGNPDVAGECGDGKTIYNNVYVNGNAAKPGNPTDGMTPVQTNGITSKKLNQSLKADGTGTIKGQFITDYRTSGQLVRLEGVRFSGTDNDCYFFYVSAQPERDEGKFYVALWRKVNGSWLNNNMANSAAIPSYNLAKNAGLDLQDNDELIIDYEIKITINASNQKAFAVKYSISHGDVKIYDGTMNFVDDRVGGYITGGDVYLHSEDNGNPNVAGDAGDGKTIYNWITVDDCPALAN